MPFLIGAYNQSQWSRASNGHMAGRRRLRIRSLERFGISPTNRAAKNGETLSMFFFILVPFEGSYRIVQVSSSVLTWSLAGNSSHCSPAVLISRAPANNPATTNAP